MEKEPTLREKYLAKYQRAKLKASKLNYQVTNSGGVEELTLTLNPRKVIQAPKEFVLLSCDYAAQESRIAAVLSQDPIMLRSFLPDSLDTPDKLEVPSLYTGEFLNDSNLGKNPEKDLHTITASASFPKYFEGKPLYEWCCIARSVKVMGKSIRDWAKTIGYGTLYLQSAETMSKLHKVKLA